MFRTSFQVFLWWGHLDICLRRMAPRLPNFADGAAATRPGMGGFLGERRMTPRSTGRGRSIGSTFSEWTGRNIEKQHVSNMRQVGFVLLSLLCTAIALDKLCTASAAGEEQGQLFDDFTATLREHNSSALVSALEQEARERGHLTPEEASLLLAASLKAPKKTSPREGRFPHSGSMLRGDPERRRNPVLTHAYASLGDTLLAARGLADQAGQQLSSLLGLQKGSKNLLQWWKENGAAAVEAAMTTLLGRSGPPAQEDNEAGEMEALLAALEQQQQQRRARGSPIYDGRPLERNTAPALPEDSSRALPMEMRGNYVNEGPAREYQDMRGAARGSAAASHVAFPAVTPDYTEASVLQPVLAEPGQNILEESQLSGPVSRPEGTPSIFTLLGVDPVGKSLEDVLDSVAGALGPTGAAIPGLSPILPSGLPSMRFSAMSILTEGRTWKNWSALVKLMKQWGHVDLDSPAARDVMQKLAVVLACAYKTAKTFLGEEQAVNMIRAAIRQNATFKEQIYSAVKKNLEGTDSAEGAPQAPEASALSGKPVAPEQRGEMDIEGRLLRELLLKIIRMPPAFFQELSHKYRRMLGHWGVSAAELESTVKGALLLRPPSKEGVDTLVSPLGGSFGATPPGGTGFNPR